MSRLTRPTIYLFDIDGTLVLTGGAGRRAFEDSFEAATGRRDACALFSFAGMTDRAITRRGLAEIGEAPSEARIDAILAGYLERLPGEVARSHADYRVLPGVREVVPRLREHPGAAVGLGTGNLIAGARIKLGHADLFRLFDFGGYGSDHEDRTELIRIGAQRGAAHLGLPLAACRVVVIGDTVRDVASAQGIGADCVGVATGSESEAMLASAGATYVFRDLLADGVWDALLGRLATS